MHKKKVTKSSSASFLLLTLPTIFYFLVAVILNNEIVEGRLILEGYIIDGSKCSGGGVQIQQHSYRYQSRFGPLLPPEINLTAQTWTVIYPGKEMDNYTYEGTRQNGSTCSYCPYHEYPEIFEPEFFMPGGGGLRYLPTPMYGPCWDGRRSEKINCVQNQVLFPQEFVGEYFYPDQKNNPIFQTSLDTPFPIHQFLADSVNVVDGVQVPPSQYGIGKQFVLDILNGITVMNSTSNTIDVKKTNEFKAPYMNDVGGNERWLMWAQHYCSIGCHRNSQYRAVVVRPEDYQNKSLALSMLSRKSSSSPSALLELIQCKPCPPYQVAYKWNSITNTPYNVKGNIVASQCFPWFGGVPTFLNTEQGKIFNLTTVNHLDSSQNTIDGVINPSKNDYVFTTPCPPNTYNDVCAHTLRYQANNPFSPESITQCKACPAGYHTDGLSGAWFCIPPAGIVFLNLDLLMSYVNDQNQSMIWSRRDRLGYEFECGYLREHCHQCPTIASTVGMFPDEFNREMILNPILATGPCPAKYFCPHPMKAYVKCPPEFPWSPPGSFSILNCTCAKGTYLNAENNTCLPCKERNICPTGSYLAGWQQCNQLNGMREGGTCVPCMNMQSQQQQTTSMYIGGAGTEVGLITDPSYGVCPFVCRAGHILTLLEDSGSECFKKYGCTYVGILTNQNNEPVYNSDLSLLRDSFNVQYSSNSPLLCEISQDLTNKKNNAGLYSSLSLPLISSTCGAANTSNCLSSTPCVVIEEASYDHDFKCVSCPEPAPANGKFTNAAKFGSTKISDRSSLCSVICDLGYYLNETASPKVCSLCTDLEAAVCPAGYRIKGQGCLREFSPFNLLNLAANCIKCNISFENIKPNYYLTYEGPNGCIENPCPILNRQGGTRYISTPCGGDNAGVTSPCSLQCAINQYKVSQCSEYADILCKNCTTFKPGYHRVMGCSVDTDAIWAECGKFDGKAFQSGFYCPGGGEVLQCPYGKTSNEFASSLLDCYCPVGTIKEPNGNNCMEFRCPEFDLQQQQTPGVDYFSHYYMKLNENKVTGCYACGTDESVGSSFTMGSNRVGIGACICPLQKYGSIVSVNINNTQRVSISCSSSCNSNTEASFCNSGYKLSPPCWTGVIRTDTTCQCLLPPFVEKAATTGCQKGECSSGFISNANNINLNIPQNEISSGSNVYITSGWTKLYTKPISTTTANSYIYNSYDYNINKLIVTYDNDWEIQSITRYQYALWTVKDPTLGFQIWTGPLPPLSNDIQNFRPYDLNPSSWIFTCSTLSAEVLASYNLEDIAITPWKANPRVATVGTFIKFDRKMLLYLIKLTVSASSTLYWGSSSSAAVRCGEGKSGFVVIPENSTVSCSSSYSSSAFPVAIPPVGADGAFYVAYSELEGGGCGVAAVFVNNNNLDVLSTTLLSLTTTSRRQITAMAVTSPRDFTQTGVWLYLAFSNTPDRVQLVRWVSSSSFTENEEIFSYKESMTVITSLSMLWAKDWSVPVYFAKSVDGQKKQKVVAADVIQRSWTEIQGMPLQSTPSLISVVETGANQGLMVASSGTTIYSIPIQQCSVDSYSVPMFWDGSQCVSHTCVRARSCSLDPNSGQEWNSTLMKCVCSAGYYISTGSSTTSISCVRCSAGSYCQNNVRYPCPSYMTSEEKSKSMEDCTCQDGQYYNSIASSCPICEKGSWCPNKWESFSCLGGFNAILSQGGAIYPTGCICSAGFTGPKCEPCPSGKYCPVPAGAIATATNLAVKLTISDSRQQRQLSTAEVTGVCDGITLALSLLFEKTSMQYLKGTVAIEKRLLCKYIPTSSRSKAAIVFVLQVEKSDALNVNFIAMTNNLTYVNVNQLTSLINIYKIEPLNQPASVHVSSNTEQTCITGKTPTENRASCECAPGYESSATTQGCISCISGYYKANAGVGSCIRCPVGKTSKIGSSACSSDDNSGNNNNNNSTGSLGSSADNNISIIAGGVVGGVVLVALLIFGIMKAFSTSS